MGGDPGFELGDDLVAGREQTRGDEFGAEPADGEGLAERVDCLVGYRQLARRERVDGLGGEGCFEPTHDSAGTGGVGRAGGAARSHHTPLWLPDPCGGRSCRPARTPTPPRPSRPGRSASSRPGGVSTPHTGTCQCEHRHTVVPVRSRGRPRSSGCRPGTTPCHRDVGAPVGSASRSGRRVPSGSGPW